MTGNITILAAEWATICGSITFRLNFDRSNTTYQLSISSETNIREKPSDGDWSEWRRTNQEQVLQLIRQGDVRMWDWPRFAGTWTGFAAGFEAGVQHVRKAGAK